MSSKETNSKKTTRKSSRSSKKKVGLFKKKTIKPKVKLDTNKVLVMSIAVIISCIILLVATFIIPVNPNDSNYVAKSSTSQLNSSVEKKSSKEQLKKTQSSKKETTSSSKNTQKSNNQAQKQSSSKKESTSNTSSSKGVQPKSDSTKKESSSTKVNSTQSQTSQKKVESQGATSSKKSTEVTTPVQPKVDSLYQDFPAANNNATLVFVFDDAGHNVSQLKKFLTLPFPITIAILPKLEYSKESGQLIRSSGKEAILHQPMQSVNLKINPGPGAIKPEMSVTEIQALLKSNISEVGPVAGLNNHEGSLITEDETRIGAVLETANQMGMYFLDSRTSSQTRVPQAAMSMGYGYYQRDIFLDNQKTKENIISELKKGLVIANKKGHAIMIGHIWSADILPGVLNEVYPILKSKGYRFTTVSKSGGLIKP